MSASLQLSEIFSSRGQAQRCESPLSGRVASAVLLLLLSCVAAPLVAQQNTQFLPNITLVAGVAGTTTTYSGDGGPATLASFAGNINSVASDAFGNIYIADTTDNVIRRVDAVTGIITTVAGGAAKACATGDAKGNGCPALQAFLTTPQGIRFFQGDLYIADNANNEIRVLSMTTGIISLVYGTSTATSAPVAGALPTATPLPAPSDMAFDSSGNMYVSSAGGKPVVSRINLLLPPAMRTVAIVAGNGTAGTTGDGGLGTAAEIQAPNGIAVDPQGNLYISAAAPNNIRKVVIPPGASTGIITTVVGASGSAPAGFAGDGGPSNVAQINSPQHICFDGAGNLYIGDTGNHRIRVVAGPVTGSTTISTIVGSTTSGVTGNGGAAIYATLVTPRDVQFTPAGDLLIADGGTGAHQVRLVAPAGQFPPTTAGANTTQTATLRFLQPITLGLLGVPSGYPDFNAGSPTGCATASVVVVGSTCTVPVTFQPVAAGTRGAPLVVQSTAGAQDTLALAGLGNAPAAAVLPGIISAAAGTGAAGSAGDTGAATAATLNAPLGIAVDGRNNYYFADSANNKIREVVASTGVIVTVAGTGAAGFSGDGGAATAAQLNAPSAVVVDGAGNLYIADTANNRVRFVSAATGIISTFAGTGTAGSAGDPGASAGAATAAQLNGPQGLYLSLSGVLYIADTGNNAIRQVGTRSGLISTVAGNFTSGYLGDTGQAQLATLNAPAGVTVDNSGNLYIADTGNQLIRRVTNGIITTFAGINTAGYSDGAIATAMFSGPTGLAVDAAGTLYIADTGNSAIRRIAGGISSTVAGTGTAGFSGNGRSSTAATLNAPRGVALDQSGNIVIAGTGSNTIRRINTSAGTLTFPMTSPNTTSAPQSFTVNNTGNQALAIASVSVPAGFAEQASGGTDCNGAGVSLVPGAACQTNIVFNPTAAQNYSGTITVTDNAQNLAAASQTVTVAGVSAYVFTARITSPPTAVAGNAVSITVSVTNPVATYSGTIHFTSSDGIAKLPADYTFTAADNGQHVFTLQFGTAGTQSVTVIDKATPSITATSTVTVVGGPAASLVVVSGGAQSALIFQSYKLPLVVKALDSLGNISAGVSVTFTAPSSGADVTFNGATTYTASTNALGLVSSPVPLADGVTGSFTVSAMATGTPGASIALTNTSNVPLGFTITSNPATIDSLPAGGSASSTLTLTPLGGFNAPVSVACTGTIPSTTCQLSTATVAASGNGSATKFTLTVTTTGPANAKLTSPRGSIFACILLLGFPLVLHRRRKLQTLLAGLTLSTIMLVLSGCAGGVSVPANDTPTGSFTLTVTGTSGTLTTSTQIICFVAGKQ